MALTEAQLQVHGEEDDVPLSQVFRVSTPAPLEPEGGHGQEVEDRVTSQLPGVEKLLGALDQKVSTVEASLATALEGIRNILSELCEIKRNLRKGAGAGTTDDLEGRAAVGDKARTSSPPHCQVPVKTEKGGDNSLTDSQSDVPRGATVSNPVVVQDDASSHSEEEFRVRSRICCSQDGPGRRVHTNPRMRVQPFEGTLPFCLPRASKDETELDPSVAPNPRTPKYRDPAGYEDVADFGRTTEPKVKLPVLSPRKNSVSAPNP